MWLQAKKAHMAPEDISAVYAQTIRALRKLGFSRQTSETIGQFFARIENALLNIQKEAAKGKPLTTPPLPDSLKGAEKALEDYYYGELEVIDADNLADLFSLSESLFEILKLKMKPVSFYLWWRAKT